MIQNILVFSLLLSLPSLVSAGNLGTARVPRSAPGCVEVLIPPTTSPVPAAPFEFQFSAFDFEMDFLTTAGFERGETPDLWALQAAGYLKSLPPEEAQKIASRFGQGVSRRIFQLLDSLPSPIREITDIDAANSEFDFIMLRISKYAEAVDFAIMSGERLKNQMQSLDPFESVKHGQTVRALRRRLQQLEEASEMLKVRFFIEVDIHSENLADEHQLVSVPANARGN